MHYEGNGVELKPYTLKELSALYQMTVKAFKGMIKDIDSDLGPRVGRYYTVIQVRLIFEKKGVPGRLMP